MRIRFQAQENGIGVAFKVAGHSAVYVGVTPGKIKPNLHSPLCFLGAHGKSLIAHRARTCGTFTCFPNRVRAATLLSCVPR